jgi:TetR/AcrR family transcriptional regulator, mexCD-oprJ operon repressor
MSEPERVDFRQEIAERNIEAILDAAEHLVRRAEPLTFSAVSHESGLSRPTVYAHFEDRARLVESLVERAVRRTLAAIASADPEHGSAVEALQRLISAGWEQLAHHETLARAAAKELSSDAMRRAHHDARAVIKKLIERGQAEGAFRTDLSTDWLVTSCLALIHAAAEEVRSGSLSHPAARKALVSTVTDLFVGNPIRR